MYPYLHQFLDHLLIFPHAPLIHFLQIWYPHLFEILDYYLLHSSVHQEVGKDLIGESIAFTFSFNIPSTDTDVVWRAALLHVYLPDSHHLPFPSPLTQFQVNHTTSSASSFFASIPLGIEEQNVRRPTEVLRWHWRPIFCPQLELLYNTHLPSPSEIPEISLTFNFDILIQSW